MEFAYIVLLLKNQNENGVLHTHTRWRTPTPHIPTWEEKMNYEM